MTNFLETLEPIARDIIAPAAQETDQKAQFPRKALDALAKAGLLGLTSAKEVGGMGLGLPQAVQVIERIAQDCPSTAMVTTMHYSGTALIESLGPENIRRDIAEGRHITTLAVSEAGSRSHIWAPVGTAQADGDSVILDARKSMVTSAHEADSYVWSSRPTTGGEGCTMWLVDRRLPGIKSPGKFDGMGLRGNDSAPVMADGVRLPVSMRLGADGEGMEIMNSIEMPVFATLIATTSIGLMEGILQRAVAHIKQTGFSDGTGGLADLPTIRAYLARARIRVDQARTLRDDAVAALGAGRPDAPLRLLEVKASAAECALEVTDIAMRVCGGAAFRKEVGIERLFRDSRAAAIMAPTSDVLFDMIGRTMCDMPLM